MLALGGGLWCIAWKCPVSPSYCYCYISMSVCVYVCVCVHACAWVGQVPRKKDTLDIRLCLLHQQSLLEDNCPSLLLLTLYCPVTVEKNSCGIGANTHTHTHVSVCVCTRVCVLTLQWLSLTSCIPQPLTPTITIEYLNQNQTKTIDLKIKS